MPRGCTTWTGYFKCREVKTGFYRNISMQTGSSGILIGWKSGQTTFVPLWDRMEGAWRGRWGQMKWKSVWRGKNILFTGPTRAAKVGLNLWYRQWTNQGRSTPFICTPWVRICQFLFATVSIIRSGHPFLVSLVMESSLCPQVSIAASWSHSQVLVDT